jgi:hypothetical protein
MPIEVSVKAKSWNILEKKTIKNTAIKEKVNEITIQLHQYALDFKPIVIIPFLS